MAGMILQFLPYDGTDKGKFPGFPGKATSVPRPNIPNPATTSNDEPFTLALTQTNQFMPLHNPRLDAPMLDEKIRGGN